MKNVLGIMTACALAFSATSASAALVNVTASVAAIGVQGTGAGFEGAPVTTLTSGYSEAGATFTTGGASVQVKVAPNDGNGAFPYGDTSTKYLSILGGPSHVDVQFSAPETRLGFYWGSIDSYNTVEFFKTGVGLVGSLTGADLLPALAATGNQTSYSTNRYVTLFLTSGSFDYARLSSTSNSFEVDNIAAGVPELSTWAMMLIGFAGLSFATMRGARRSRSAAAA